MHPVQSYRLYSLSQKAYHYKGWRYCYNTTRIEEFSEGERPWIAWIVKPDGSVTKIAYYAKRVSAQKAALRWCKAHKKRNETQAKLRAEGYIPPSRRCNSCEERWRDKDDYLCRRCRFGT